MAEPPAVKYRENYLRYRRSIFIAQALSEVRASLGASIHAHARRHHRFGGTVIFIAFAIWSAMISSRVSVRPSIEG
jgi:hypothetical protein